jgi:hypothetical protein
MQVDADLSFSFSEPATADLAGRGLTGTLRGTGSRLELLLDSIPAVSLRASAPLLRAVAAGLAAHGLSLSVSGPDGLVLSVGAVRARVLDRVLTRSRHVRLDRLGTVVRLARNRSGATSRLNLADLVPAPTLWPVAPTYRRQPRRVTTTHDPLGGGSPRLIFPPADSAGARTQVFYLRRGTTTVGSSPGSDLRLDGLADAQAEIRRDERDEYVLHPRESAVPTRVNGTVVSTPQLLRTGTRIDLGSARMVYFRAEDADHGRPYGGRIGGELGYQRPQPTPRYRSPGDA